MTSLQTFKILRDSEWQRTVLVPGNVGDDGLYYGTAPAKATDIEPGKKLVVVLCEHDRLNDNGDACLDCGAIYQTIGDFTGWQ